MKQRRVLWMGLAGGLSSAAAAGAARGWGEMPRKYSAAFVHHRFGQMRMLGAGAAPRGHFPSNTAALHAATDDSVDPFGMYDESMPDTAAIFESNLDTLARLGIDGWRKLGLKG